MGTQEEALSGRGEGRAYAREERAGPRVGMAITAHPRHDLITSEGSTEVKGQVSGIKAPVCS